MRNFSKIFLLFIGINIIYGKRDSKIINEEKKLNIKDISKYYEKLIANHILK